MFFYAIALDVLTKRENGANTLREGTVQLLRCLKRRHIGVIVMVDIGNARTMRDAKTTLRGLRSGFLRMLPKYCGESGILFEPYRHGRLHERLRLHKHHCRMAFMRSPDDARQAKWIVRTVLVLNDDQQDEQAHELNRFRKVSTIAEGQENIRKLLTTRGEQTYNEETG